MVLSHYQQEGVCFECKIRVTFVPFFFLLCMCELCLSYLISDSDSALRSAGAQRCFWMFGDAAVIIQTHGSNMLVFIFLYTLGINICQATNNDNSTQMYYYTLTVDKSVFEYLLGNLSTYSSVYEDSVIQDLKMTTTCENETVCSCASGHRWSDAACMSASKCCGEAPCSLSAASNLMCVSNSTVGITGNITLTNTSYQQCLMDKTLQLFKDCDSRLLREMKSVFSTIRGFDTLKITQYSVGSIIATFAMTIVSGVKSAQLLNSSIVLNTNVNGYMDLVTSGIVHLELPDQPVQYHQSVNISCISQEDLGYNPQWNLKSNGQTYLITNGTVSKVAVQLQQSTISLNKVDELWEGEYTCVYIQQKNSTTIYHKANKTMKICLQPQITVSTQPAFPRCTSNTDVKVVTVICEIPTTNEKYNVTWSQYASPKENISGSRVQKYTATKVVSCDRASTEPSTLPLAQCDFVNTCQQNASKKIAFIMIYTGDKYCAGVDDWGDTMVGYTAVINCQNQAGVRRRYCTGDGKWQDEVSECVNQGLFDVLQSAIISDIGLGALNLNAEDVFSRFQNVTKTSTLNSFANMNTSVLVLSTMQPKLTSISSGSAIDNFLDSSSNLLNETLVQSWNANSNDSYSLASKFLNSVENLVKKSNTTGLINKLNLQVYTCNDRRCNNTVFNVSVKIDSSSTVKTIGYKSLDQLLPTSNDKTQVNSIVVSTTTDTKQDNPIIEMLFDLHKPRPRNVVLQCAFWNNETWSTRGCMWGGSSNEGLCTCDHLSAFTILISSDPIKVPMLDQITSVGLGISVVSLIICLVIELIVWSDVVKTNTLYLRHTAHVNIALCLLVANACFLASSNPEGLTDIWCRTSVVLKHFCYLAMFFWMLCLSITLLHQAVFLFHKVSKRNYLRFSLVLGYGFPFIIVFVTFLSYSAGAQGLYYSSDTCWLVYKGLLQGSYYTFVIPVGIIIFVNVFSMVVVIMKLLSAHHQHADASQEREKAAAKTVLRAVILLTPIFGVTWVFGLAVEIFDLTDGPLALAINYLFVILNAFQGLFILLTSYLCDKMTRDALMKFFKKTTPAVSSMSESTTKLETSFRK
ncbi:adhesion G-protein coupled receptor F3 [Nothobranchius furzeri]|uniref:G protein-coupled receptor 116 n=2 Tax=Nothobranchius TaxID=28779 RepID=A0A1A8VBB1_NOTFU